MRRYVVVGSCNMDHVLQVASLPRPGETILAESQAFLPGGKGANQAVALQRLGLPTLFVGAVGEDGFGRLLRQGLAEEGVDVERLATLGPDSGLATVLVSADGQSTIVVAAGANGRLRPEAIAAQLADLTPEDTVVAQLEIPLEVVRQAFSIARQRRARTVLDPAPAVAGAREILALADLVLPNRHEAGALVGRPIRSFEEAEAAGRALLALGAGSAVVKLDRDGACYVGPEGTHRQAAWPVVAVDATAAGDAFLAGFLFGWERGGIQEGLRLGAKAGAVAASRLGARASLPTVADLIA